MRLPVTVLLLSGSSLAYAQTSVDLAAEAAKIRAADVAWFEAEARRDLEKIVPYVAEDAVFQPPDAPACAGIMAIRAFYKDLFALPYVDIGGRTETVVVASSGDVAYDIGRNFVVLTGPQGEKRHEGKYLAVWRKVKDRWKLTAISWSLDAPIR
jgi:uncharacterized protein (TIGR02246 family)